ILNPRLLSHSVEVHPLVVVMALLAGSAMGGLAGMLIAVPSAAFIKVQLERWLVKREAALAEANYGIVDLPEVDTPSSERKTAHKASLIDIMHDVSTGLTD
ncbi:MAG: AI-2E family transporter, partial [Coriobacteriales bacterium]|nr:AI-2E family transporter [Coriobacteriales bacterium]